MIDRVRNKLKKVVRSAYKGLSNRQIVTFTLFFSMVQMPFSLVMLYVDFIFMALVSSFIGSVVVMSSWWEIERRRIES